MRVDADWHQQLAAVVTALRTPAYQERLVAALGRLVSFDFSVMFAYRGNERPIDLFDNFGAKRRQIFVTLYQEGPYLLDPFFLASRDNVPSGLYRLRELAPDRFYQSEYFRSYYTKTGLSEEIGFFVVLTEGVSVVMSLMRSGERQVFSEKEMERLRLVEPFVRASAEFNWQHLSEAFTAKVEEQGQAQSEDILEGYIDTLFQSSAPLLLSLREREVVGLVLRGHSSDSIAKRLGIAPGTVKVHRKNIYSKLGITSQSELFSIFLNALSRASN